MVFIIYFFLESKRIQIIRSSFKENNASQGSLAAIFGDMSITLDNLTTENNTFIFGNEIALKPKALKLRVYDFIEELLYSTLSIEDLTNHKETVIY